MLNRIVAAFAVVNGVESIAVRDGDYLRVGENINTSAIQFNSIQLIMSHSVILFVEIFEKFVT